MRIYFEQEQSFKKIVLLSSRVSHYISASPTCSE